MTPEEVVLMEVERELAELWRAEWARMTLEERAEILFNDSTDGSET